jgi:gluconokinase
MPKRQRLVSIVLTGTAGAGKTSVMRALEARLGWPTLEGDALHPPGNIARMAAGLPLSDSERAPWLEAIAQWIGEQERRRQSSIVACSALKRAYRNVLRRGHPSVWFVRLDAPAEVLADRIAGRSGHFMPATLLPSQLAILEEFGPDEPATTIDARSSPAEIAEQLIETLRLD